LELNNFAASLKFSAHSLSAPPAKVLCDGTHPTGGALKTTILLAPSSYNSLQEKHRMQIQKLILLLKKKNIYSCDRYEIFELDAYLRETRS
jgi:hypothetical protein